MSQLKRKITLEPRRTPSKRARMAIRNMSLSHTFWGLELKQRSQLLDLYKEAQSLLVQNETLEERVVDCNISISDMLNVHENDDEFDGVSSDIDDNEWEEPNSFENLTWMDKEAYVDKSREKHNLEWQKAYNNKRLDGLAKDCAVLNCAALTTVVHTRLPRELRDQIYDYLWTDEYIGKLDLAISSHNAPPWFSSNEIASSDLPVPFFADTTFTADKFAHEAAVWYFQKRTGAEINYRHVRGYLERKSFGPMPFDPKDAICQLNINIEWLVHRKEDVAYAALRDSMESLLTLRDYDDLVVHIYLSRDLQFLNTLFHVLDIIKPVFQTLQQKGPKMIVIGSQFFAPSWRDESAISSKKTCATVEVLNGYLTSSPVEWFAIKDKEIESIAQEWCREKCYEILEKMRNNYIDVDTRVGYPGYRRAGNQ